MCHFLVARIPPSQGCPRIRSGLSFESLDRGQTSERELQRELQDARRHDGSGDGSKGALRRGCGSRERCVGIVKLRMVEGVEELGTKLQCCSFARPAQLEFLEKSNIPVMLARPVEYTDPRIAETQRGRIVGAEYGGGGAARRAKLVSPLAVATAPR